MGSCISSGQVDFFLDVFPLRPAARAKCVTDFGRFNEQPPPLQQDVSKPSGRASAKTVTAAREWSMGVWPGTFRQGKWDHSEQNHRKWLCRKVSFSTNAQFRFKLLELWFMTICFFLIFRRHPCSTKPKRSPNLSPVENRIHKHWSQS